MGRRVLVTGLATFWGGRLAQALEADPSVEVVIGLDTRDPHVALERSEFIRADPTYSILARLVLATRVDTILHTFLVVDGGDPGARSMHETNVIATMNLCAAASAPGTSVATVVVKSSTLVYGASREDPSFFAEEVGRSHPPIHRLERSLLEVEGYVKDFALDNPDTAVSILRYCNFLGGDIQTTLSRALDLPMVPSILGFDPRLQFVHEEDVVRSLRFAMDHRLQGAYNVAGDGVLPWSEVVAIAGKRRWPLPPVSTAEAARFFGQVGAFRLTPELLDLLRYGRGVDNRRLKEAGFAYRYDSAGALTSHVEAARLRRSVGRAGAGYRYQQDVEDFFRRSPAVIRTPSPVPS